MVTQHNVYSWGDSWFGPIIGCMYRGELSCCEETLALAWQALRESGLTPGEQRAAEYRLHYYAFQARYVFGDTAGRHAAYGELMPQIAEPQADPTAEIQRNIVRLLAATVVGRDGLLVVPRAEVEQALAAIPEDDRGQEMWHALAGWAFAAGLRDLVALSYEGLLLKPSGFLSDYSWRRANLMLLLLEGRAGEQDVLALIRTIRAQSHFNEFQSLLWPAIESAGLCTPAVVDGAQHACQALAEQGQTVPKRARKTQTMRTESLEELSDPAPGA